MISMTKIDPRFRTDEPIRRLAGLPLCRENILGASGFVEATIWVRLWILKRFKQAFLMCNANRRLSF